MPDSNRSEPLYVRGKYKLVWDERADGTLRTPYLQIVWYDDAAGRNRSKSTGTADSAEGEIELDRLFLKQERGQTICPTCGQVVGAKRFLLNDAINNYLVAREGRTSFSAIKSRLAHVVAYLEASAQMEAGCEDITEEWIDAFREWAIEVPVFDGRDAEGVDTYRDRALGTVEASVRQLAAAINFALKRKDITFGAPFRAKSPDEVDRTPTYRADIPMLAAMFHYCVDPEAKTPAMRERYIAWRRNLLRFLQVSVATWARPDAAHDVSTDPTRDQWHPQHQALNLNPRGRQQTKKHRPIVPAPRQLVPILDKADGYLVSAGSVRQAFEAMQDALGLPRDRETGMKLIRRSIAKLARTRLGERDWIEGRIMLGHYHESKTSDVYAPFQPGYLGRALEVTEGIIAEIEALVPDAFSVRDTGVTPECIAA